MVIVAVAESGITEDPSQFYVISLMDRPTDWLTDWLTESVLFITRIYVKREPLTEKEIKRLGFALSETRYNELLPLLSRLQELEDQQKHEEERHGSNKHSRPQQHQGGNDQGRSHYSGKDKASSSENTTTQSKQKGGGSKSLRI